MLYLYGCPISVQAASNLVAMLVEDGAPDAVAAASQIGDALHRDRVTVALPPAMRDAVFATLVDPPSELNELRNRLGRDIAHRSGETPSHDRSTHAERPYRLILIDRNGVRTKTLVGLDAPPQVGDHLDGLHGGRIVVHHVAASQLPGHDGVIIAGNA